MTAERPYPDEPAGEFPSPPRRFVDDENRTVELEAVGAGDEQPLFEMYKAFDPKDRAQGIPPIKEEAIERWLEQVIADDCYGVVATHEGDAVGHAMLVPDQQGTHELAIFVLSAYQSAGIGTALVETLLGLAQAEDLEKVWLTVERWNEAAIGLYRKVGFEVCSTESFEMEMAIRLH